MNYCSSAEGIWATDNMNFYYFQVQSNDILLDNSSTWASYSWWVIHLPHKFSTASRQIRVTICILGTPCATSTSSDHMQWITGNLTIFSKWNDGSFNLGQVEGLAPFRIWGQLFKSLLRLMLFSYRCKVSDNWWSSERWTTLPKQ